MNDNKSSNSLKERYPALRITSLIYRALAYICVIAGVAVMAYGFAHWKEGFSFGEGKLFLVGGALLAALGYATFLSLAESIIVFLDIEKNTRRVD